MITARRSKGTTSTIPAGLAFGGVISVGMTLAGSAILAKLIEQETFAEEAVGYGAMVILLVSASLGCVSAYSKIRRQRAMVCATTGAVYYLILLSMTALFFGGQYTGIGVTALVIAAGCGCAALLGMGQGRGGRQKSYTKQVRKIVQTDHW